MIVIIKCSIKNDILPCPKGQGILIMSKLKECPKCKSKDLSSGENDFIYSEEYGEVPIQFCNKCHEEWFV